MKARTITLRMLLALTVGTLLAACETQVSLETAPQAIVQADGACPGERIPPGQSTSGAWGTASGNGSDGVDYTVNPGFTVTFCAQGRVVGSLRHNQVTVTGPDEGFLEGPINPGDQSDFTGFSVSGVVGPSTTTAAETTTSAAGEGTPVPIIPTTTTGGTTTTIAATTLTQQGISTTTAAGDTTTSASGQPVTTEAAQTTTTAAGATTTSEAGASTIAPGNDSTTTVEVGGGTLDPGQVTSTTGGPSTTGDPGEEATTTGDEVAGGSESTLPYTGAGDMTMGGLAGLLVAAGIVVLLLVRRRPEED